MINSTNKRLMLVAALLLSFLPLPFFMKADNLFILLDAVTVSVGLAVIMSYLRGSLDWIWDRPKTTAGHLLVLGITASWLAIVSRVLWIWALRLEGKPRSDLYVDHWFLAVTLYIFIIGGALHLLAYKAIDDKVPLSGWITLFVATVIGITIGIGVIYLTRA